MNKRKLVSRNIVPSLLFCAFVSLSVASSYGANKVIVLDGTSQGRTFHGIGAVSAGASSRLLIDYPEPYRSQILDYLFKPDYGASLQHLKVEIGADVNSTDGSEPSSMRTPDDHNYSRGYEWWLMEQARKRNPNIVLDSLPWGAPGWVGKFYSQNTANYITDWLTGAKGAHNLDLAYTGIWNETPYDTTYIKDLYHAIKQHGLNTKIVCCDEYPNEGKGQWAIVDAIQQDPQLNHDIAVVTVHYPRVKGKVTTPESAKTLGKPLWSSEDQPASSAGYIHSRNWAIGGRELARLYNENYLKGGFTATEIWSPITSYYDILAAPNSGLMYANTPWSGNYRVQGAIWATAHTTQFTEPGWQYLDSSSGYLPEKGSYVTLKSPNNKDWSTILETINAKNPQRVDFTVAGNLSNGTVHIWETNSTKTFEHVANLTPHNGKFTYNFDPDSLYSLTTTTGQGKGTVQPPPTASFPFPYKENFETTPFDRSPKYLSDQDGAFEVHPCIHRRGRCLEQVITTVPIPWGPLPDPWTLAGDEGWTNYRLSSDILLSDGPVTVIGRIDSTDVFAQQKARWPSGYIFRLNPDGRWSLFSAKYKTPIHTLASGITKLNAKKWHLVELTFQGSRINVNLDHHRISSVTDSSHVHGMIGVGTGWNRAQFDNIAVVKTR